MLRGVRAIEVPTYFSVALLLQSPMRSLVGSWDAQGIHAASIWTVRMEPLVVVLTLLASVGLGFVAAYVTLSILLFVMQRAMMPTARRVVERRVAAHVDASVRPTQ